MAVSRGLLRLLRVRTIEEELGRQALESAQAELRRLEAALTRAGARELEGRRLVRASAVSGETADRLAGVAEQRAGAQHARVLQPWRAEAAEEAEARRGEFLERRAAKGQAETLVREETERLAAEADRRAQLALDDWFGARLYHEVGEDGQRGTDAGLPEAPRPIWAERNETGAGTLEQMEDRSRVDS